MVQGNSSTEMLEKTFYPFRNAASTIPIENEKIKNEITNAL